MVKLPTLDQLKSKTPEERLRIYQNAKSHPDGRSIMNLIDNSGLSLSSGGLTADDPVVHRIREIIWSAQGRAAATEATSKGLPALCGVDPLIHEDLQDRYHKHDWGIQNAGFYVAELMRHMGYVEDGTGRCPAGCTAKSGVKWKPK